MEYDMYYVCTCTLPMCGPSGLTQNNDVISFIFSNSCISSILIQINN